MRGVVAVAPVTGLLVVLGFLRWVDMSVFLAAAPLLEAEQLLIWVLEPCDFIGPGLHLPRMHRRIVGFVSPTVLSFTSLLSGNASCKNIWMLLADLLSLDLVTM